MQSYFNVDGNTLLEKYSQQVVTSQLSRRAQTAVIDRDICTKNVIELKSYFTSSLTSVLLPDLQRTISWVKGLDNNDPQNKNDTSHAEGTGEVIQTLHSMASLLIEIQQFAELEAGICSDMPESLEINEIIRQASINNALLKDISKQDIILSLSADPLSLLCHHDKLIQCFSNILRFAATNRHSDTKVHISVEKTSDLKMTVVTRYFGLGLSDAETKRMLTTSNLVEHMIVLGIDNPKLIIPISCALVKLHSGGIAVESRAQDENEIRITLPIYNRTAKAILSR